MAHYRKLGRTASQRKAMLRSLTTSLLLHGKIETTETRAKEVRKIAEKYIALAVKEKDNFETVTVQAKVTKKDKDGNRVKKVVDGKKVTTGRRLRTPKAGRWWKLTWSERCSTRSRRSTSTVRAVTPALPRSALAAATLR